ncbi:MAG: hypothetical protein ACKVKR_16715 [Pseudomonadales bacterium]|jgi:hypothetical protein
MKQYQLKDNQHPEFKTIKQFVEVNPAFTESSIRWLIFNKSPELEAAGAVVNFGRRKFINPPVFLRYVQSGGARRISGSSL